MHWVEWLVNDALSKTHSRRHLWPANASSSLTCVKQLNPRRRPRRSSGVRSRARGPRRARRTCLARRKGTSGGGAGPAERADARRALCWFVRWLRVDLGMCWTDWNKLSRGGKRPHLRRAPCLGIPGFRVRSLGSLPVQVAMPLLCRLAEITWHIYLHGYRRDGMALGNKWRRVGS